MKNDEKEIQNIAEDICRGNTICTCSNKDGHCASIQAIAKRLYEQGYKRPESKHVCQKSCKKCGSVNLYTENKGNSVGLYCSDCGSWIKWLGKDELRAFEHNKSSEKVQYKMCPNADIAIYILEFIKRGYAKNYQDAGVQKYLDALQMGIDALMKIEEDTRK